MDAWKVVTAIRMRWGLFLICFLLAVLAAVMIPREGTERVFISSAKVLLTPPSTADMNQREMGRWWFTDEATLRELASSERLLRRVITRLKLRMDWLDLKKCIELTSAGGGRLSSGLFQISVTTDNSEQSRVIADALVEEFVLYIQELSAQEFASTRAFLENLVAEARGKVDETENKLLALNSSRTLALDERDLMQSQSELEAERLKLREDLTTNQAESKSVSDFISGSSPVPPWSILKEQGATSKELEQAVASHRLRLIELSEVYKPDSAVLRHEEEEYGHVNQLYEARIRDYSNALLRERDAHTGEIKSRLQQVEGHLAQLRTQKLTLAEKREVTKLERQLSVWEESRLELVRQLYQARVAEQSSKRQGAISILERASRGYTPKEKRLPSLARSLAVGIPFGLLFSFSIVVLVTYLSTSLRLLPRIEQSLGLPILAVIPKIPPELAQRWERIKTKESSD